MSAAASLPASASASANAPAAPAKAPSKIAMTIAYLKACQEARARGEPVYLVTDPEWLLDMAIGRRAGWAEDPHSRGIAAPAHRRGCPCVHREHAVKRPAKVTRYQTGDAQAHLRLIADEVNRPRLIVRPARLGEWKGYLVRALPERFTMPGEE